MEIKDWEFVLNNINYCPASHIRSMTLYQNCYFGESDTSKVLYENNKPIGIWPGIIGGIYQSPLFITGISEKVQKKAIESILYEHKDGLKTATDFYINNVGLSVWSQKLTELGAEVEVKYDLYCNLTRTENQIWSGIRGSYHPLINKLQKEHNLSPQCLIGDKVNWNMILNMKYFHRLISGKETRSIETWEKQFESIKKKEAFVLFLYDIDGNLIAASLFNISRDECLYSVAVYDRELTENKGIPLGHLTVWEAIKYAKKLGIKWFKLGEWQIDGNAKKQSISKFKKGFASHIFPRFEYDF